MEEFRILLEIEYNENKYKILCNNKHQKYFMKVIDKETLDYPTIQEYEELYKIFGNNTIKQYCFNINNKFEKGKIKLEPKVKLGKGLISLAMAISLLGCNKSVALQENDETTKIVNIDAKADTEQEQVTSFQDIEKEKLNENVLKIKTSNAGKTIYCDSLDEFSTYVENGNPTYQDVKKVLAENTEISGKYKRIISQGIDNLEEKMPEMNLSVLYYNLSRMKIIEKTDEEIKEESGENARAYFDKEDSSVIINSQDIDEDTILHEVLGHGSTCTIMQKEDGTKIYMGTEDIMLFEDTNELKVYGSAFSEAIADEIEKMSLGDKGEYQMSYAPISEQLEIFLNIADMSLNDFMKLGTTNFISELYKLGIKDPFIYIERCDTLCSAMQQGLPIIQPEMSVKRNLVEFLEEYANVQQKNGESTENIIKKIDSAINDSTFSNIIVFDNGKPVENLELPVVREEVAEKITKEEERI